MDLIPRNSARIQNFSENLDIFLSFEPDFGHDDAGKVSFFKDFRGNKINKNQAIWKIPRKCVVKIEF